jgi:hypothetical protein
MMNTARENTETWVTRFEHSTLATKKEVFYCFVAAQLIRFLSRPCGSRLAF